MAASRWLPQCVASIYINYSNSSAFKMELNPVRLYTLSWPRNDDARSIDSSKSNKCTFYKFTIKHFPFTVGISKALKLQHWKKSKRPLTDETEQYCLCFYSNARETASDYTKTELLSCKLVAFVSGMFEVRGSRMRRSSNNCNSCIWEISHLVAFICLNEFKLEVFIVHG